ncbi:MAG: BrxA/BrxB family bacilliredoxin [Candidatus Woesearchaeota archaeon]
MEGIVKAHKEHVSSLGLKCLSTVREVDDFVSNNIGLLYFHSLCGCAGMKALPIIEELHNTKALPINSGFVFAGQDREATSKAREYLLPNPPSSPSIAVLKDSKPILFVSREDIQESDTNTIVSLIKKALS